MTTEAIPARTSSDNADLPGEEWRAVEGYAESYEVSNLGRVRSKERHLVRRNGWPMSVQARILAPILSGDQYLHVRLYRQGQWKFSKIHRLVATAFIAVDVSRPHVNHIDHCRTNNVLGNLEWSSRKDNLAHSARHGRQAKKLTAEDVRIIRRRLACGERQRDIAVSFGVAHSLISNIRADKIWSHVREQGK